ncbi:MAG: ribonuclease HII [Acidobacteriota bacterium]
MRRTRARRTYENALRRIGFVHVAGVDEVGRGCLAGPVVAAAVLLDPARPIPDLADSKLVPPAERVRLAARIRRDALGWALAELGPADIDQLNIHRASLEAMKRAVEQLVPQPDVVLIDGFRVPGLVMAQRGIVHGDRLESCIAAASILAKVYRDALMCAWHASDPRYGYHQHKGYATPAHLAAVARHGYSAFHRRTFRPKSLFDTMGPTTDDPVN